MDDAELEAFIQQVFSETRDALVRIADNVEHIAKAVGRERVIDDQMHTVRGEETARPSEAKDNRTTSG